MHSTGRLLGLILWDVDKRKPGESGNLVSSSCLQNEDDKILKPANPFMHKFISGNTLMNGNGFNHCKNSQEMLKLNAQFKLHSVIESKNLFGKREKLLNRREILSECKPDCIRMLKLSDSMYNILDRKMQRLISPEEYHRNRANSANSDNSNDNNQNGDRRASRGPFVPRYNWYREDPFETPAGSGFTDPLRIEWSNQCPDPVEAYNEMIDSNREDITENFLTLELTSRTKLKNMVMTLEKVDFESLQLLKLKPFFQSLKLNPDLNVPLGYTYPKHAFEIFHPSFTVLNRLNLVNRSTFDINPKNPGIQPNHNVNNLYQYGLTPDEVQFNDAGDKLSDETRLEFASFTNIKAMMTFAASNLERIKSNNPFGFLLHTPAMIDAISFPNNLVMTICLPAKAKLIAMFEKARKDFPYGCPLQSEIIPERERLENDYFQNFQDPRFKGLCNWFPFTTEMTTSSIQFHTCRFNSSMTHYRPMSYQSRVLNYNIGLNIRGQLGNVLNKKGFQNDAPYQPFGPNVSENCCYNNLNVLTSENINFQFRLMVSSLSYFIDQAIRNLKIITKRLCMIVELFYCYNHSINPYCKYIGAIQLYNLYRVSKTAGTFYSFLRYIFSIFVLTGYHNILMYLRRTCMHTGWFTLWQHHLKNLPKLCNFGLNNYQVFGKEFMSENLVNFKNPKNPGIQFNSLKCLSDIHMFNVSRASHNFTSEHFNSIVSPILKNLKNPGIHLYPLVSPSGHNLIDAKDYVPPSPDSFLGSFVSNNPQRVTGILDLPVFEFYQRLDKYEESWFSLDAEDSLLEQWKVHSDMLAGTQFLATATKKVHERFVRLPEPTPELPPMGQRNHPSSLPDRNDPELIPKLMNQIGELTRDLESVKKGQKEKVEKKEFDREMLNVASNLTTIHSRQTKINRSVGQATVIAETALLGAKKALATNEVHMALNLKNQEENVEVQGYLSAMNIPKSIYISGHLQLIKNLDAQIECIESNPDQFIRSLGHLDNDPEPENYDKYIPVDLPSLKPSSSEVTVQDVSDIYYPNPARLNEMLSLNGPMTPFSLPPPISASGQKSIPGPSNSLPLPQPFPPGGVTDDDVEMHEDDDSKSVTSDNESFVTPTGKNIPAKPRQSRTRHREASQTRSITPPPPLKKKKELQRKLPDDLKFTWMEFSKTPLDSCSDTLLENMNVECTVNCANPCFPELSKKQAKVFPISQKFHFNESGEWPNFGLNKHNEKVDKIEQDFSDDAYLMYRYCMIFHLDLVLLNLTQIKQWPAPSNDIGSAKKVSFRRIQAEAKFLLNGPINELAGALGNDSIMIKMAECTVDDFKTGYLMPDMSLDLLNLIFKRLDRMGLNLPGLEITTTQALLRQLLAKRHPHLAEKYKDLDKVVVDPPSPRRSAKIKNAMTLAGASNDAGDAFSSVEANNPKQKETTGNDFFVLDGQVISDYMVENMFLPPYPQQKPTFYDYKDRLNREDQVFDKLPAKVMGRINLSIVKARNRKLRIERLQQIDHKVPLVIVSTNLNDPRRQVNHLIHRTDGPDIIMLNELFLPETHILKRTFLNTDLYSFIYNAVTFRKKKYVFSLIMIKKTLDAVVTKIPIAPPFVSANVTLRLKNDQKVNFNIATFYMPHNPSKAQTMLNIKPAKHFHVLSRIFRRLFKIQSNIPSILTGDLNCDYRTPREQDNKVFAGMFKRHTAKYRDLAGTHTHIPHKRAPGQKVKPSRIDVCMVKGLKCKFKQTSGHFTAKNDGHVVFHLELDLEPVFNDSKIKIATFSKPDPEEIFEKSMLKYEMAQFDLIKLREECVDLAERRKAEGTFEPISEPVPYLSKIINLVNSVTEELIQQKEVFVNRFNKINKMPPENRAVFDELNNLIVKSSERELSGRERLRFRNLKILLETMCDRDRQDYLIDYVHSKKGRVLTKKEQFSVNRRFNNKSKGEAFPETLKIDRITDIYRDQMDSCKPKQDQNYKPIQQFIRGKISRSDFNIDWWGPDKRFSLSAAARELQPLTLGYNSRINRHILACYHNIYRKLFLDLVGFCLTLGYFPPEFKNTKIVPIPKQGQECIDIIAGKIPSIRFLGVSACESQLMSKSVSPNFTEALEQLKILPDNQHAFRKVFSTSTCICEIFNNINRAPKDRIVMLLSFDIKKAFDSIPHEALGQRLDQICEPNIAQYLKDELRNRSYYVTYRGQSGEKIEGNGAGVLQGGCNSPVELALMLSDINTYFQFDPNLKQSLFADDVSMVCVGDRISETDNQMIKQRAIGIMDKMTEFLAGIGLSMNRNKTGVLIIGKHFYINLGTETEPLLAKEVLKILGLRFKCDLFEKDAFEPEINHRKQRLGEFRTCLTNISDMGYLKFRKLLAFLFVYGILNYAFECIPIQPASVYSELNYKITRIIIDLWNFDPYSGQRHAYAKLFGEAGWMNARNTHYYNILNFANRVLINRTPPSLYRELLSILRFNDGTPYTTNSSKLSSDRKLAQMKFKQGLYPIVSYSHSVQSEKFFPYCLEEVFKSIPNYVLKHLGHDSFKSKIHYELKFRCQHPEGKACSFCNIQINRSADILSVSWIPHLITGYGCFNNDTIGFNENRQIALQSESEPSESTSSVSQSPLGQKQSVSTRSSASQPPKIIQSDSFQAISNYNAYHDSLVTKAILKPAQPVPYHLQF